MSDDAPKSALEIAMEKLKQRDRESGEKAPAVLTGAQKRAIADIRSKGEARLAEVEILFRSNRESAGGEADATQRLEEEYRRERRRIEEKREAEIAAVRAGKPDADR